MLNAGIILITGMVVVGVVVVVVLLAGIFNLVYTVTQSDLEEAPELTLFLFKNSSRKPFLLEYLYLL